MSNSLPIQKLEKDLSELPDQPPFRLQRIGEDLDGNRVAPMSFGITVGLNYLYFAAIGTTEAWEHVEAKPGFFYEGLWERDVAELFIGHSNSETYLEINLSPSGAWWSGLFSGHRKRMDVPHPDAFTESSVVAGGWMATIGIPLSYLETHLGFDSEACEKTRANVTAILGGEERHHLSWSKMERYPPDFHCIADFLPLDVLN